MLIWHLSEAEIREAARLSRLAIWNDRYGWQGGIHPRGKALSVRLCVDETQPRDEERLLPFQKRSYHGRRLPYVTWEGHREFMRQAFKINPDARIKSALADYRGFADFLAKHPATRNRNLSV